jgi:uncharacterized membrane protein
MVVIRWINTDSANYIFLIWNLFLSWIPLGVSMAMSYIYAKNKDGGISLKLVLLGSVWFLFYPNAPYMLTDYIHFKSHYDLLSWYDLVMHSVFIWTSFLIGFVSIYLVNRIVQKATNKFIGWFFTLFVLFLSSYGIYLGRVIRWNSWDIILNPLSLIHSFFENINYESIIFSIIFGMLLTLIYAFLYGLTFLRLEKTD